LSTNLVVRYRKRSEQINQTNLNDTNKLSRTRTARRRFKGQQDTSNFAKENEVAHPL